MQKKKKKSVRNFWDNIKCTKGVPEEEEKKKRVGKILEEIIIKNFPNMGREIATQIQETQRVPYRRNPRRNTPRQILIKLMKIKHKEQTLKAPREKQQIIFKGIPTTPDLSTETAGQEGVAGYT